MWSRLRTFDPLLFLLPVVLIAISVIFIFTLSFNEEGSSLPLRQAGFAAAGVTALTLLTFVDYRAWRAWKYWFYSLVLFLLVITPFVGTTVFGATSWIDIGPISFQPSELSKIAVVILIAGVLQTRGGTTVRPVAFWFALALYLLPIGLILAQPDFGTALVVAVTGVAVFLHARLRLWQRLLMIAGILSMVAAISLSFANIGPFGSMLKDYQKDRLASFLDPSRDPGKSGYNVLQSKIAVGSGGVMGQGLGYGSQSQLNFLPVVHTDFIFAAIAEAWGLIGSYGIIAVFFLLIARLLTAGRHAQDEFGYLVCIGFAAMIAFQLLVNVGMNIGLMPVTGIPLPFVSYGGTALISVCMAMGIAQAIVVRSKRIG